MVALKLQAEDRVIAAQIAAVVTTNYKFAWSLPDPPFPTTQSKFSPQSRAESLPRALTLLPRPWTEPRRVVAPRVCDVRSFPPVVITGIPESLRIYYSGPSREIGRRRLRFHCPLPLQNRSLEE